MGFSVTGSHVIFFVASVIVAGAVSGVFIAVSMNLTGTFQDKAERLETHLETDFAIINDPRSIPHQNGSYIFYVKNIGSNRLICSNQTCQAFIDGVIIDQSAYHFNTESLYPDDYAELYIINSTITTGYHTLRLVAQSACEDTLIFTIE